MELLRYRELNPALVKDIRRLEEVCRIHDHFQGHAFLSSEFNEIKELFCFYLLYDEENRLISFMNLFLPSAKEAEISGFTLPEYRRQGLFRQLFHEGLKELERVAVPSLLFVSESVSQDGCDTARAMGGVYEFSEYFLRLGENQMKPCAEELHLVPLEEKHRIEVLDIYHRTMGYEPEQAASMLERLYLGAESRSFVGVVDGKVVSVCSYNFEETPISLFGLGVLPEFQGKGYGKETLRLLTEEVLQSGRTDLSLEVDSENQRAFHIYRAAGFEVVTQLDYFRRMRKK